METTRLILWSITCFCQEFSGFAAEDTGQLNQSLDVGHHHPTLYSRHRFAAYPQSLGNLLLAESRLQALPCNRPPHYISQSFRFGL